MSDDQPTVARPRRKAPRHPGDAVRVVIAGLVLVVSALLVHRHRVGVHETDIFRVFNDLPPFLLPVLWPVMQLGNIAAVPLVAGVVALTRRFRLAAEIIVAGVGVWLLAKVVKGVIVRGRPASLLPHVHIHGAAASGRGFLSGHAAVATAILTLAAPYLGRRTRRAAILVVVTVGVARMYVGAHLPLDVIAGAALGWGVASAVHLVLGAPTGQPSERALQRALTQLGLGIERLVVVDLHRQDAAVYRLRTPAGDDLFVKVLPRERRDRDLLYRTWLRVIGAEFQRRAPAAQAEHEALVGVVASRAGVRTPAVVAAGRFDNGAGLLVRAWVDARPVDDGEVTEAEIADIADVVAALHAAGIAHRRLAADTLLRDADGRCWLVGLDGAALRADAAALAADVAALQALLVRCCGADAAARAVRRITAVPSPRLAGQS